MKARNKGSTKKWFFSDFLIVFTLFLLSVIPLLDLSHPGLPITHDGQDHVARIANFYLSLEQGNLLPRWAGNLNWGYGHPVMMFLYPLPSYLASFFHFLKFSYTDSLKIIFGATYVLSGFAMFFWIRNFLGRIPAFISAIIYLYSPYRFVDLYVRGAIGEHVAFMFVPLIFYFLLKLSRGKTFSVITATLLAFSVGGLILAHNAISLMFFPLIGSYALYLFWAENYDKKFLFLSVTSILVGFFLSAFFWAPAFFEGKYTLRDIVTKKEYLDRFVQLKDLLYGPWSYGGTGLFTVQIGIPGIISFITLPYVAIILKKYFKKMLIIYLFFILTLILSVYLMLPESKNIWSILTILQKFQFPWRLLSVVVFASSVIGGFLIYALRSKWQLILGFILIFLAIYLTKDFWHALEYKNFPDSFYEKVYEGTTDTGESSPIWSVRFMEKKPARNLEFIWGKGETELVRRNFTNHIYKINVETDKARIRENTLYFPGWNVFINGKKENIEFQDPANRGLITFYANKGFNKVEILFGSTKIRTFSSLLSLGSFIFLLLSLSYLGFKKRLR